ncbi:hypothetical protein GYMLUDRAFT_249655 [Collybiopsis luxurians FD-317 M1]|uniref:ATP-dependent DNA helicase n=1 Tax=Collybiopsis luxurians FD-317 M1 TaxID=944289 RepID=A0A0D0BX46_9AGAR|nr:hypothetical protein GYMLUDRAFT_249655 [Collybiopsis luxurians FD-317 M1]
MPVSLTYAQQAIVDRMSIHSSSSGSGQLLLLVTGCSGSRKTEILQAIYLYFLSIGASDLVFKGASSPQGASLISGLSLSSKTPLSIQVCGKTLFLFNKVVSIESYHLLNLSEVLQKSTPADKLSSFFAGHDIILFLNYHGFSDAHYPLWDPCITCSLPILSYFTSHMELVNCIAPFDQDWLHFTASLKTLTVTDSNIWMPCLSVTSLDDIGELPFQILHGLKIITTSMDCVCTWNDLVAERFASLSAHVLFYSNPQDVCANLDLDILNPEDLCSILDFISMGGHVLQSVPLCKGMLVTIVSSDKDCYWGKIVEIILDIHDPHFHTRPLRSVVLLNYPPSTVVICLDNSLTDSQDHFVTLVPLIGVLPRFALLEKDCIGQFFNHVVLDIDAGLGHYHSLPFLFDHVQSANHISVTSAISIGSIIHSISSISAFSESSSLLTLMQL